MIRIFCLLVCCIGIIICLQAQSKDEKEVAAAVETLRKALINADKAQLEKITAPELSYGHSSGIIEDKTAFVKALTSGKSDFATINLTGLTIKIAKNTAIVRHQMAAQISMNGQPTTVNLGALLIWIKQQGQWKLLARQAFKL